MSLPEPRDDEEARLTRREIILQRLTKRVEEDGLHIYDALRAEGLPRSLMIANARSATFQHLWALSQGREHEVDITQDDLPTVKARAAMAIEMGGLSEKLGIMAALADPMTKEGQRVLFKLADAQAKLTPKETVMKKDPDADPEAMEDLARELQALRNEREKLLHSAPESDAEWHAEPTDEDDDPPEAT